MPENQINKLANDRTTLIETITEVLERKIGTAEKELLRSIVSELVDKLDRDGDRIKNTLRNKRLISFVDDLYSRFAKDKGLLPVQAVANGVQQIVDFNGKYFGVFTTKAELAAVEPGVKDLLNDWLGITKQGKIAENGYLKKIVDDPNLRQLIKNQVLKAIVTQEGYQKTKDNLQNLITGNEETGTNGKLKQYYRNFVYDTFSVADRTAAKLYADKLKFNYAIYEGGLVKASRKFCKLHNGKVYSREEIAAFKPTEAIPPDYNPFTDLGGYGCRHHLNWIPDSVAFALRPELRQKSMAPQEEPAPAPAPKDAGSTEKRQIPAATTPFDKLPEHKSTPWSPSDKVKKILDSYKDDFTKAKAAEKERDKLAIDYNVKTKNYKYLTPEQKDSLSVELAEILKKYEEQKKIAESIKTAKAKATKVVRDELTAGLTFGDVYPTVQSNLLLKNKGFFNKHLEATKFFKLVAKDYLEGMEIKAWYNKGREFHNSAGIHVNTKTTIDTIVHELAHRLESHNYVLKAAVDFLNRRTKDKPLLKLNTLSPAYRSDEVYKEGGFFNAYIGKFYEVLAPGNRNYEKLRATEVISMGVERMYSDPAGFFLEDQEHFNLIYSLFFTR